MRLTYTVVLLPDSERGYVVEVPALPGCLTEGKTLTEALAMVEDAIEGYVAVLAEDGDPIPREGKGVTVSLGRKREAILRKVSVTVPVEAAEVA
jgi:predicted RNase H-like HicB family nuclease